MATNKLLEFAQDPASRPVIPAPLSSADLLLGLVDAPMYRPFFLHTDSASQIARLCKLDLAYDRFCPTCRKETPWTTHITQVNREKSTNWGGYRHLQNYCKRCKDWEYVWLYFEEVDDLDPEPGLAFVVKVGQYPSVAVFHGQDMARYTQVSTQRQRDDFTKAVEAASHGFAAGACTYLRRVLEGILNEARDAHMKDNALQDWPEYDKAKTNKKMELLKDRLPPFLTENKRLYNLLSQGIHSLPDDECQELYPVLREAIELLFEERLAQAERDNHRKKVSMFIAQNDNPKN